MNRQELRRNSRKKSKTYNLTAQQIATIQSEAENKVFKEIESVLDEILKKEANIRVKEALIQTFYVPLLTLRNMGWGKKRLGKFAKDMIEQYVMFEEKYYSTDDVKNMIYEETGLKLDFKLDFKDQKSEIRLTTE